MNDTFELILGDVVEEGGLGRVDGRPLYAYRSSEKNLNRLEVLLKEHVEGMFFRRDEFAAAFCLFAAEHFRRVHEEGAWR